MGAYHKTTEWRKARTAYLSTMAEFNCTICGKEDLAGIDLQVDHIVPGNLGNGEFHYNNEFDNLAVVCSECNGRKSDRRASGPQRINWKSPRW